MRAPLDGDDLSDELPKTLRNGPCGGVRPDGGCEVKPEMRCVWLKGWERSRQLPLWQDHFNHLRPPVDNRLDGTSSWRNLSPAGTDSCRPVGRRRRVDVSRLEEAIAAGRFIVTAELLTIDTGGLDAVHERFAPFEGWVDAVNATDNTAAHAHASSVGVAIALKQLGMEPVMQLVCRDRNRLALQADIMGGALHGIENICCLTGDDVTAGDEPEARRVFDLDRPTAGRDRAVARVRSVPSGRAIDPAPHLFLGAVENPGAPPFEYRVERALKKVEAGARFLQLQVVLRHRPPRALHGRGRRPGARRAGGGSCRRSASSARLRHCVSSTRRCRASRFPTR